MPKKKSGNTLVELMVTLTILVIAGGPIIFMFITASKGVDSQVDYYTAMYLTRGLAEKHLAQISNDYSAIMYSDNFSNPHEKFSYTIKYDRISNRLYKVTITTSWEGPQKEIKYPLSFMVSRKNPVKVEIERTYK
ncbi:MAG: type IV pilus modification PilV family protein [Candidatus Muiribacteriota bacterium]